MFFLEQLKLFLVEVGGVGIKGQPGESLDDRLRGLSGGVCLRGSQVAALGALQATEELDALKAGYRRNRDLLQAALRAGGVDRISSPDGAFYLYADVSHLTDDAVQLCSRILEETGIAITPRADFDTKRGQNFIRLSYCTDEQSVLTAAALLTRWLRDQH